jgi:hypothetical protein
MNFTILSLLLSVYNDAPLRAVVKDIKLTQSTSNHTDYLLFGGLLKNDLNYHRIKLAIVNN